MSDPKTQRIFTTLASISVLSLVTACSSGNATEQDGSEEVSSVRISQATPLDFSPVWVAIEEGFFDTEGLDVELAEPIGTGAESIAMINSGQVDLIAGSPSAMISAAIQGLETQAVVGLSVFPADEELDPAGVIVTEDSDIEALSDLEGAIVGVTSLQSQQQSKVEGSVDAAGGDSSDIEFVQVPPASMVGLLESGEIDAAQPFEPGITRAVDDGGIRVIGYANWQVLGDTPAMTLTSTPQWIEEQPDEAAKVRNAITEAVDFMNDPANADRTAEIMSEYTETPADILSRARMDTPSAEVSLGGFQKLHDHLLEYHIISEETDVSQLIWDAP